MSGRPPQDAGAPPPVSIAVLLAGGPAAAQAAVREAERLVAAARGGDVRRWTVSRAHGPPAAWTRRLWRAAGTPRLLVAHGEPAAWIAFAAGEGGLVRLARLRAGLLAARDALGRPWPAGAPPARRWAARLADDALTDGLATLSEDELFGEPRRFREALAALLDLPAGPSAAAFADPPGYAAALAEALGTGGAAPEPATDVWAPGGVFPMRAGGAGAALLGAGWSHLEADRVWSEGARAELVLPPAPPGRVQVCRLVGVLARRADAPVVVRAAAAGRLLGEARRAPGMPEALSLTLRLPPAPDGPRRLELAIEGAVRARDVDPQGDTRSLGLALMRVELRDGGAADGADPLWDDLLGRGRSGVADVRGRDPAGVEDAAARLRAAGYAVERQPADLVVLCDATTAAAWFATPPGAGAGTPAVLLAGGDPEAWPEGLEAYAARTGALIQVGEVWTAVEPGAAP